MKFREYIAESTVKQADLEVAFSANNPGDADIKIDKKTGKYYYWNPRSSKYIEVKDIKDIEKNTDRYTKK